MNPAELLRAAAVRVRALAENATPGPWEHVDYAGSSYPESTYLGCGSVITWAEGVEAGHIAAPDGDLYPRSGYSPKDDMAHIALWHPGVALAVADWLDAEAEFAEQNGKFAQPPPQGWEVRFTASTLDQSVAVARALLPDEGGS